MKAGQGIMGDVIVLAERRRMREQNRKGGPPEGPGGGVPARPATFLFDLASPLTYLAAELKCLPTIVTPGSTAFR